MSQEPVNRRRIRRQPPRGSTKVACRRGTWGLGANLARAILDVSLEGARLIVTAPLEPGQEVEVELEGIWQQRPLKVSGRVMWSLPAADGTHCVGVRFEKSLPYAEMQSLVNL